MSELLDGLPGVVCHVDDVLVSGNDQEQHDSHMNTVLKRIQAAGLTLNKGKCQFSSSKIVFLGHVIDANGISADPEKTEAIKKMKPPTTVTELRRFMGRVNQLSKFSSHIPQLRQPLQELLKSNTTWMWTSNHDEASVSSKMNYLCQEFWLIITVMPKQRSVLTHHHMVWELSFYSNKTVASGNQGLLPHVGSLTHKATMHRATCPSLVM